MTAHATADPPRAEDGAPEALRVLPGVELLGRMEGSGLVEPPYLVRRPDHQVVQLTRILFLVAKHARPGRDLAGIAGRVSDELQLRIRPEQVEHVLEAKLVPVGLVAAADGSVPDLKRLDPFLGLSHRMPVLGARIASWIGNALAPLFATPAIVATAVLALAFDVWLVAFHGIGDGLSSVIQTPSLTLLLMGLAYAGLAFHEFGHAAACRYGGGRPGAIGIGIYLVWPVFYSDVTDSYRFTRAGRLRVDLGGVYFNVVFALALAAAYLVTGYEPLLLAVVAQHAMVLNQFLPWVRLDGYHVVSDLIGVSDLFSRIKPVLRSMVRKGDPDPRVAQLKPWARAAVTTWVVTTVVFLAAALVLLATHAPRYLGQGWTALVLNGEQALRGAARLRVDEALVYGLSGLFLLLPVLGLLLTYAMLCRGAGTALAVRRARAALRRRHAGDGAA